MENEQYINHDNPVYISVTDKDKSVANNLCKLLQDRCIEYRIYTKEDIQSIDEFEKEIGNSKIVVIIYSSIYFTKPHCMNEYALIRKNEEGKKIYVVKCEDFDFKEKKEYFLRHWGGENATHTNKNYYEYKRDIQAAIDNMYYLDEDTKYSVKKLEQFFRDIPTFYIYNLEELAYKIEDYIIKKQKTTNVIPIISDCSNNNLPELEISTREENKIVPRNKEIQEIKRLFQNEQFVNITGMGGCGKTTISEYFVIKYKEDYNNITGIFINGDFEQDFSKNYEQTFHTTDYTTIITQLNKYPKKNGKYNLLIIDINETADYTQIEESLDKIRSEKRLANWKILVISREKIDSCITEFEPLKTSEIDDTVLRSMFFHYLDKKIHNYYQLTDNEFKKLFYTLFYLPLLIEQLAYFLNKVDQYTLYDIFDYLGADKSILDSDFSEKKLTSMVQIGREQRYTTVGNYLSKLMIFSKLDTTRQSCNIQKDIARHLMMWPTEYYSARTIMMMSTKSFDRKCEMKIQEGANNLVDKNVLDKKTENGRISYKIHGLIAETFRKQVFENDENEEYRNFDVFLEQIKRGIEFGQKDKYILYTQWLNNNPEYHNDLNSYKFGINHPIIDDLVKNQMVFIKGIGKFNGFYIGRTQVSQQLWNIVMGNNPNRYENGDDYPVDNILWSDCLKFIIALNKITKLKFRLPNQTEWGFAAQTSNSLDMFGRIKEWCHPKRFDVTSFVLCGNKSKNFPNSSNLDYMQGENYENCGLRLALSTTTETNKQ